MAKSNLSRKAEIFSALGDETRLGLVQKLVKTNDLSISELTDGQSMSRQAITKHLRVLEDVGLVKCEKEGRESRFKLDITPLEDAVELLEKVGRRWDQRLMRLKMLTENTD
jgi:DNA-binding transcriptional ArsR family regulator